MNDNQTTAALPAFSLTTPDGATPETITVNGVEYRRNGCLVDVVAERIEQYKAIAKRTGVPLKQAVWFAGQGILPD